MISSLEQLSEETEYNQGMNNTTTISKQQEIAALQQELTTKREELARASMRSRSWDDLQTYIWELQEQLHKLSR